MTGKVLNNRYELVEKIGTGGMADVYKARCRVLKRWVAVKILKDEFVNDEEFLERFEREAYAAGSLNHPNIVSIYDVGRDGNIHYIVMEYVDGITLKEYIRQNGALPWEEAADIAISILSALHKAHRHNIIHRDIKPQNILITSDNVPKVSDFGIARAATTATATRKIDTVGSVHYASPEQARGGYTDEKSDIYSVGVTLFEMVTGHVPFDADNPVTVALKQINDEPPKPSDFVPGLPEAMDNIILRAMKKSKAERYDSALQMIAELDHMKKGELGENHSNSWDTQFATRVIVNTEEETLAGKKDKKENKKDKNEGGKPKKSIGVAALYVILIGAIIGALWLTYVHVIGPFIATILEPKNPDVELKSYIGMTIDEAIADLTLLNIPYEEPVYEYNDTVEKGIVIEQSPAAGMEVKTGADAMTKVKLVVSNGKQEVEIPKDLKFADFLETMIYLRDELKLKPVEVAEYSDEVALGRVIKTEPEMGSIVQVGSQVKVYKSLGPELEFVTVPDLSGCTLDEAKHILLSLNLSLGKIFPEGRDGYKGLIINQEPKPGETVKELTPVNVYFQDEQAQTTGDGGGSGYVSVPGDVRITEYINLPDGVQFGDTIFLEVYTFFEKTGEETLQLRVNAKKTEFPKAVLIPVTPGYKTVMKVYMDNKLQYQKDIYSRQ
ncbi:MAG: Stk1 family PASTA domain-containing Ser/Thr kinase [Clostridiaceae bacterium]|nr:Stk1 family PASTA domain-containing Ser/Thr kinase [Clostridiaceae bacterium]